MSSLISLFSEDKVQLHPGDEGFETLGDLDREDGQHKNTWGRLKSMESEQR